MSNFYLYLFIGLLVVYIIGLRHGGKLNRLQIGGDNQSDRDINSFSWIVTILAVIVGLHFILPEEFRATSLFAGTRSTESPFLENTEKKIGGTSTSDTKSEPLSIPLGEGEEKETDLSDYEFFTELSDSPAPPPEEAPPATSFSDAEITIFQTGAFRNKKNAERMSAKLAKQFPTQIVYTTDGIYHIGFGPFDSKSEAEETAKRFKVKGKAITFIYE